MWQFDFSEFETSIEGTWQLGGTVDYWAKTVLGCRVSVTKTASDMIASLEAAIATAQDLLDRPLNGDCLDVETGEIEPVVVVTDNGPAMRSIAVARWFADRPWLTHVRTRHRAPQTNGVIERWFESLKYERLYRHDIEGGDNLAAHVEVFLDEYNTIRPHETIGWQRPLDRYLTTPKPSNRPTPKSEQES